MLQKEIPINEEDTVGLLHDALLSLGAPLIVETLVGLMNNSLKPIQQQLSGDEKEAPKLTSENTRINWNDSLKVIINKIRGLSPYPGAWSLYSNNEEEGRIKIFKANPVYMTHTKSIGQICVIDGELFIATKEGYLNCSEIQLPNKKRMTAQALLNGYFFVENARVLP